MYIEKLCLGIGSIIFLERFGEHELLSAIYVQLSSQNGIWKIRGEERRLYSIIA